MKCVPLAWPDPAAPPASTAIGHPTEPRPRLTFVLGKRELAALRSIATSLRDNHSMRGLSVHFGARTIYATDGHRILAASPEADRLAPPDDPPDAGFIPVETLKAATERMTSTTALLVSQPPEGPRGSCQVATLATGNKQWCLHPDDALRDRGLPFIFPACPSNLSTPYLGLANQLVDANAPHNRRTDGHTIVNPRYLATLTALSALKGCGSVQVRTGATRADAMSFRIQTGDLDTLTTWDYILSPTMR